MSRSSARRGQVEPLAALAAVLAVGVALAGYAGALDAALPAGSDRDRAEPMLDRAAATLRPDGVARPARLARAADPPRGYRANLTLTAAGHRWTVGPPVPGSANTVARRLPVRVAPGEVRRGRLRVGVWR